MVIVKSNKQIEGIRIANQITRDVLLLLQDNIKEGITTLYLDKLAREYMEKNNSKPAFLGYQGFPGSICVSINEQVIHGKPSKRILKEGDIVSIDTGANYNGFVGDAARTIAVGKISPEKQNLIDITEQSFFEGIKGLMAGVRLGDLGNAIQTYVEANSYSVVKDYTGHGVGVKLHEDPSVPNYGTKGRGMRLLKNMTIAIEPMVNMGSEEVELFDDWTVVTSDGKPSAHYENSILILEDGIEILSL